MAGRGVAENSRDTMSTALRTPYPTQKWSGAASGLTSKDGADTMVTKTVRTH